MFSLTKTGTLSLGVNTDATVLPLHFAECLRGVLASNVEIRGNCVAFTGGVFRLVSNWNVLVPFGSGDTTIHDNTREVTYRVSVRQLVWGVTGMLVVGMLFMLMSSAPWQVFLFIPLMWLWLVGGNVVIWIARFKGFVGRAIATAPRLSPQSHH